MIIVRKHITTETAHRLMDYVGKCADIHGHSYKWEVEIAAPIQSNGIAIDFKDVKALLVKHIFEPFDHKLLLCADDEIAKLVSANRKKQSTNPTIDMLVQQQEEKLPGLVLLLFNPTAENLARYVGSAIASDLHNRAPDAPRTNRAQLISLTCWETENSYAKYAPYFV